MYISTFIVNIVVVPHSLKDACSVIWILESMLWGNSNKEHAFVDLNMIQLYGIYLILD